VLRPGSEIRLLDREVAGRLILHGAPAYFQITNVQ